MPCGAVTANIDEIKKYILKVHKAHQDGRDNVPAGLEIEDYSAPHVIGSVSRMIEML
jgi:hypothetical protein